MLRACCLALEIMEFRCFEAKIEESERPTAGLITFLYFHLYNIVKFATRCTLIPRLPSHVNQALKMNMYQLELVK